MSTTAAAFRQRLSNNAGDFDQIVSEMLTVIESAEAKVETSFVFPETQIDLRPGEHYAGIIIGKDGEQSRHLILLPGEVESINWKDAKAWANEQGGRLPTRREQALLFANLKEQFQDAWYWSSEEHASDSDYAWSQYFDDGTQYCYDKSSLLRARAVRSLIIE
jgi:hypothetical protein